MRWYLARSMPSPVPVLPRPTSHPPDLPPVFPPPPAGPSPLDVLGFLLGKLVPDFGSQKPVELGSFRDEHLSPTGLEYNTGIDPGIGGQRFFDRQADFDSFRGEFEEHRRSRVPCPVPFPVRPLGSPEIPYARFPDPRAY